MVLAFGRPNLRDWRFHSLALPIKLPKVFASLRRSLEHPSPRGAMSAGHTIWVLLLPVAQCACKNVNTRIDGAPQGSQNQAPEMGRACCMPVGSWAAGAHRCQLHVLAHPHASFHPPSLLTKTAGSPPAREPTSTMTPSQFAATVAALAFGEHLLRGSPRRPAELGQQQPPGL